MVLTTRRLSLPIVAVLLAHSVLAQRVKLPMAPDTNRASVARLSSGAAPQKRRRIGFALEGTEWNSASAAADTSIVRRLANLPRVAAVDSNGPAARAGVRVGDTLAAVDGHSMLTPASWRDLDASNAPLRLTLHRDGRIIDVALSLEDRPRKPALQREATGEATAQSLRYTGTVAKASVDVWSSVPITTSVAPTGELIIHTGTATIRVRPQSGFTRRP